jgi:hypothetical protein
VQRADAAAAVEAELRAARSEVVLRSLVGRGGRGVRCGVADVYVQVHAHAARL